jgi:hypothetical protein
MTDSPTKKKLRPTLLVFVVLGLGLAGVLGVRAWRGKVVPIVHPKRGDLVAKVVTTGRVLPQARIQLGSTLMAQVTEVRWTRGRGSTRAIC